MNIDVEIVTLIGGFAIVAIASSHIARLFQKIHFPLITGLLFVGIICGPFVLGLIPISARVNLNFISDIALSYIAFAAGSELYLKELRSRFKSIKWITAGQLIVTFLFSGILIYVLQDFVPFLRDLTDDQKTIVALLSGVIFIARSPASAIAVINEVRAKGPFTRTVLGVTVLKDFIVIIMFAIILSVSIAIDQGEAIRFSGIMMVLLEVLVSFLLGFVLYKVLGFLLSLRINYDLKRFLILFSGYSIYLLFYFVKEYSGANWGHAFMIEPLLICIIASFMVTNFSKTRPEFLKILKDSGRPIYVAFFTLAGAVLAIDVLSTFWIATVVFFLIRLASIMVGAYVGGVMAGDSKLYNRIGWMPYVTQAGVGLGLALIVARTFPEWGFQFATIITSMIVVNQVIGPPLFKWSLNLVKEAKPRAAAAEFDGVRDAIIFGLESQSVALARQLVENGWEVKIATFKQEVDPLDYPGLNIQKISAINLECLNGLDAQLSEAIVLMLTDDENLVLAELIYENVGTKDVVVRLNHHYNFEKFHKLGALVVDPSTAIVSLLDHFVRSPQAASLLLGLQSGQDTMDLEMLNTDLHGIPLRDIRLPADIIILSVMRAGQMIITHGYTRLRLGDVITIVGSRESLKNLQLRFDNKE
ncbi:MAG: cation:proton antiporter [Cyclobacteriaceae bacterium]|nr:cation:proton antiporter [Cyclobacteriaceae bacterium]